MTATAQVVDGDIVISEATGRPVLIRDTVKLRQDVRQAIDESGLEQLIGRVTNQYALRGLVASRLSAIFLELARIQQNVQFSERTLAEQYAGLSRIDVFPKTLPGSSTLDPTSISFRVSVVSRRGEPLEIADTLSVGT